MNSVEVAVPYDDYVGTLDRIIEHLESGHGSPAVYPLWWITKRAREDITVYLEGQGADELLGGYVNAASVDHWLDLLRAFKLRDLGGDLRAFRRDWSLVQAAQLHFRQSLPAWAQRAYRSWAGVTRVLAGPLTQALPTLPGYDGVRPSGSQLNRRLLQQHTTGLVNLLHYGDGISMAQSLENRLPFMDYRLVNFAFGLDGGWKLRGGFGKYLHRRAFADLVPGYITNNPRKLGFVSPLRQVFMRRGGDVDECLLGSRFRQRGWFNPRQVERYLTEHREGRQNHERVLFKLLSTELWLRRFMDPQAS